MGSIEAFIHILNEWAGTINWYSLILPRNIYAAINGVGLGEHQWGVIYLLIRLPLQLTLIAWAYYLCIKIQSSRPLTPFPIKAL